MFGDFFVGDFKVIAVLICDFLSEAYFFVAKFWVDWVVRFAESWWEVFFALVVAAFVDLTTCAVSID